MNDSAESVQPSEPASWRRDVVSGRTGGGLGLLSLRPLTFLRRRSICHELPDHRLDMLLDDPVGGSTVRNVLRVLHLEANSEVQEQQTPDAATIFHISSPHVCLGAPQETGGAFP